MPGVEAIVGSLLRTEQGPMMKFIKSEKETDTATRKRY